MLPSRQPESVLVDRDGPLLRVSGGKHYGCVEYRDLAGLTGPALDELIERTCRLLRRPRERFEWKTHSYDEPADLPDRLTRRRVRGRRGRDRGDRARPSS